MLADKNQWKGWQPSIDGRKTTGMLTYDGLSCLPTWADTEDKAAFVHDQSEYFSSPQNDGTQVFMAAYIETLQGALQNADPALTIIRIKAPKAQAALYQNVFERVTPDRYANFLQSDYHPNKQIAALAAAMNYVSAYKRSAMD